MQRPSDAASAAAGISHLCQILPRSVDHDRRGDRGEFQKSRSSQPLRAANILGVINARFPPFTAKGHRRSAGVVAAGNPAGAVADYAALCPGDRPDFCRSDLLHGAGLPKPWLHGLRYALRHEFGARGLASDGVRHVVSNDERQWDLTLRDGLFWHDGERVLARDCVASIRRWAARDGFGGELMEATDELSATDDRTIRFRLKRPFPLLPQALGKAAINACFMMPERLASQDPFKPLTEVIGSGPLRYLADERVQGARNAYARFERYQPRSDGKPDWTAGPKIVHYDRVVWTTTPDAGTGVAALQTGEQDWQETTPHDLLPIIKAAGDIETRILDPRGYACMLRLNHLQPPFDNPAIRRALLGAIDQSAFMTAVAGDDPAYQSSPIGFFAPGTPMASDVGLNVFRGPREMAKVKADLKAAGYNGEKVVLLVPTNSVAQKQ